LNVDVGQIIAGKYELVRLLGKGAMGEVWAATHNSLGGEFAIKLVEPADDIEAETAAGRFQLEAQIAAKLSRKTRHIVSVSDHGEESGLAYLVMELLEGESLEQKTKRVGPLSVPDVAAIVSQVARALSLAHEEGIFHRDLKPANVWLAKDEDGRLLVKLLDFGIARSQKPFRTRSPFMTSKDMVLGTPSYMSPEQARGLDSLDYRCDLWALAVVAYEALTRKIPFEGDTVEDIFLSICTFRVVPALTRRPDLPPAIEAFFARAFAPKLEERFSSAAELTEAFEQLVAPEDLEAALGIPFTPTSARRLEAARASNPQFGSNPDLARLSTPTPTPSPALLVTPLATPAPPDPRASSPDSPDGVSVDPVSVALQSQTVMTRRRRGNPLIGWMIAGAGLVALVGMLVLVLVTLRSRSPSPIAATRAPASTGATVSGKNPEPPPTGAEVTPLPAMTGAAEPPSSAGKPAAKAAPAPVGKTKPGGRVPTASTVASHPGPPPAPAPAPPPAPAPAKPVNKGEVF
jgi:serine/threonine-protein kinase